MPAREKRCPRLSADADAIANTPYPHASTGIHRSRCLNGDKYQMRRAAKKLLGWRCEARRDVSARPAVSTEGFC